MYVSMPDGKHGNLNNWIAYKIKLAQFRCQTSYPMILKDFNHINKSSFDFHVRSDPQDFFYLI